MREFVELFHALDVSTSTAAKVAALRRYLATADERDAAWVVYFLAGGKPRQSVGSRALREYAIGASGIPAWLFDECYDAVGDLAETIALLLPPPTRPLAGSLAEWIEERLLPLRGQPPDEVAAALQSAFGQLDARGRFVFVKLIGGGFRVGVSKLLVIRAVAEHAGIDARVIAQRMMGFTDNAVRPDPARYRALIGRDEGSAMAAHPYPFFLAHALQLPLAEFGRELGQPDDWLIEWKYDGIRAQLVRRAGQSWLWSRGEELIGENFPDVLAAFAGLPDGTVLDGEIVVWLDERPAPFALLQKRIARRRLNERVLKEIPALFIAFDLLESGGEDWRARPQHERRAVLQTLAREHGLMVAPLVEGATWHELAIRRTESRARAVEGLMLKHRAATYRVGRTKDPDGANWWKWKIDPFSVDAVLVYAQPGHGRRASLFTDYTFAVWDRAPRDAAEAQAYVAALRDGLAPADAQAQGLPALVPFAKAYSGLTDTEIRQVDATVRRSTIGRFGPVRSVVPVMIFELGFEGIQRSPRHRSGIAVRFPRMLRWRTDKPLHEADTLETLERLLAGR
ncbi:MAG TPA: ATP-dependent DNA ligase [Burkholderiaceae bacterium]|nr:ATP-dependent DNA ligase [Burkholderiaceae bacterium]